MFARYLKKVQLGFVLIIVSQNASADGPISKSEYHDIFMSSFTYMTVMKACNNTSLIRTADLTLDKVIQYGYKYNLHDNVSKNVSQNLIIYTMQGIEEFGKTAKVSCSEGEKYMRIIAAAANKLN